MKSLDTEALRTIQKLAAANRLPLAEDMIEKDILVADAVRAICAAGDARGAQIIFGGGTSLSMAQQVIQRMSEDADFRIVLPADVTSQNQRRHFLSAIKTDILNAMEQAGFPLEGDLKARNGNAYIMGNFGYASAFARSDALRPQIKLEITAFEPVAQVEMKPLRTILDRVLERPASDASIRVPVVSLPDTLADKVVGYLRRTAADRAGCGRGAYDDRLVRHLYDIHCILRAKGDLSGQVAPLFLNVLERDRETYGNQFPAFLRDPQSVLRDEMQHLTDSEVQQRYDRFCQTMIYGEIPAFKDVIEHFRVFAEQLLSAHPVHHPVLPRDDPEAHIRKNSVSHHERGPEVAPTQPGEKFPTQNQLTQQANELYYGDNTNNATVSAKESKMPTTEPKFGDTAVWTSIQNSLEQASRMLDRAENLIRDEFEKIQASGQYRLPVNPDMVQSCEKDWIIGMVNLYHDGQLNMATLKKVLQERDHEVRPLMGEGDAKTLTALIEHVDGQVVDKMMQSVTEQLASAKLQLQLAQDARKFLGDYRQRVYDAYTMGLGKDYKEQWAGKYGHRIEDKGPEWKFADVAPRKPPGNNKP